MILNDKERDNKEYILKLVKENGLFLCFASDRLRDDKDVVLEAVKNHEMALQFASDRLRKKLKEGLKNG